jgi:ApbE superfamily uncharacterized protein (UPF0280 family)
MNATRSRLTADRWHFQHGPIDLIIGADGAPAAVDEALERAWQRFGDVLPELVRELPALRQPVRDPLRLDGTVAQRMFNACWPHRAAFITPMAAVAGAVADELIRYFSQDERIRRAYINNGGDIALHLQAGQRYRIGLFADLAKFTGAALGLDGDFDIDAALPVRGIATSGWRGRSFSLGIADSVTVLAADAAAADAAATMIANQVNGEHPAIRRAPASSMKDDTDLGDLPVTAEVGILPHELVRQALHQGARHAAWLQRQNLIAGAVLTLQGQVRTVGLGAAEGMRLQAA